MCCLSVVIEAERSIVDFESSLFTISIVETCWGLHTFLYKVLEERKHCFTLFFS